MLRPLTLLLGSAALAATLTLTATAQEYSDGGHGHHARGPAVLTPVELYGVHPPGPGCCRHGAITPYYAPVAPTPTCRRWHTTCYTPYYCGYCPHRLFGPKPPPYGWEGGCVPGATDGPGGNTYGPYTAVLKDDTTYWNMGGNGLVPYGTPRPPHGEPPDLIDMIQASRGGGCAPAAQSVVSAPPIMPPAEKSLPPQ
jgi:hypothetical protein